MILDFAFFFFLVFFVLFCFVYYYRILIIEEASVFGLVVWRNKKVEREQWNEIRAVGESSKEVLDMTCLWPWVPWMCVYLPKCHHYSVSITWKHLKCVFSFHNSSLKNQKIEWWKQKLETKTKQTSQQWIPPFLSFGWWK